MKPKSMSKSIFKGILMVLAFAFIQTVYAKDNQVHIGVDVGRPIQGLFSKNKGFGVSLDYDLKNKLFPSIEWGRVSMDKSSDNGNSSVSSGDFVKIGLNKAFTTYGNRDENRFYAGVHFAHAWFDYDFASTAGSGGYWDLPVYSASGLKADADWLEIAVGVRVGILDPLSIGWKAQYKRMLHVSNDPKGIPALVPGYGVNNDPQVALSVHLYYSFSIK